MRGLRFHLTVPQYLITKGLGRFTDEVLFGTQSGLRLEEVSLPKLPAQWAQLEVIACGICGSDLACLACEMSPAGEPFSSFPAVMGHEILARVVAVGSDVTNVRVGQRVAIDPVLSCAARGYEQQDHCRSCRDGFPGTCGRAGDTAPLLLDGQPLGRGTFLGFHAQLPGGFSEQLLAHESQLHLVPDAIDDECATLIEPLSVGVHAVLQANIPTEEPVLVIGGGPIGLSTVWALHALGHKGPLLAQVKRPHEAALARGLGATQTIAPGTEVRSALLRTGAKAYRPLIGPEVFNGGGFRAVFDCVGSTESLDQAFRYCAPRGSVVLLGCAGQLGSLDFTPVWSRELRVQGYVCYGREQWEERAQHTFEVTMQLLQRTPAQVRSLVTDVHSLEEYRTGFTKAMHRARSGAVKVLLKNQRAHAVK